MTASSSFEQDSVLLSSINILIGLLSQLPTVDKAQSAFANDIYSRGNGEVFELSGVLEKYQEQVKLIVNELEDQLTFDRAP